MPWWGWIIFGAFLLGSELLVVDAAFFLVFIGIAAMLTGVAELIGIELVPWGQWILFASIAAVSMVLFRKKIYDKLRGSKNDYQIGPAGESIRIEETLQPGGQCRMEFRGTTWNVINEGVETIETGSNVQVASVEGLTLKVIQTTEKTH